jgi:hypothetical protein
MSKKLTNRKLQKHELKPAPEPGPKPEQPPTGSEDHEEDEYSYSDEEGPFLKVVASFFVHVPRQPQPQISTEQPKRGQPQPDVPTKKPKLQQQAKESPWALPTASSSSVPMELDGCKPKPQYPDLDAELDADCERDDDLEQYPAVEVEPAMKKHKTSKILESLV